ncbi:MAG: glycerophosphodiester phosphodiesterase [Candidatus Limnocylindria bacterium]
MGTLRLAHRGDWRVAPENTLPALQAALAVPGCDGLEFDVRVAADGVPVLLHDETLARVQGRPERVDALSSAALAELGVPTLADALTALPRSAFLDVELKGLHDRAVVEALAAGRGVDLRRAVVSSFEAETLERIAALAPTWPRWLNADDLSPATIAAAHDLGCRGIAAEWRAIDDAAMRRARAAGLEVAAWTVRRRSTYARLARLGVAAVCVEAAALDG